MKKTTPLPIVGVIFSRADLQRALRMRQPPSLFEIRLDRFVNSIEEVSAALNQLPARFIITARDPREGGANNLSLRRRRALLLQFLPRAAFVDVELRSVRALAPVLRSARAHGIPMVISFHDLKTTPSAARLDEIVDRAQSLSAPFIKVATRTDTPTELARLLDFSERHRLTANIIPMGMGKLGRKSRLQLAKLGWITYVHLGSPSAPGQLSLGDLRRALR